MLTCKECKERLYPDDPRLPSGKYGHNLCDYFCDKPSYYRELEAQALLEIEHPIEHIHRHINYNSSLSKQDNNILQQTSLRTKHLEKAVNEHLRPKPKHKPKYS